MVACVIIPQWLRVSVRSLTDSAAFCFALHLGRLKKLMVFFTAGRGKE
jgi:hypothetical protein